MTYQPTSLGSAKKVRNKWKRRVLSAIISWLSACIHVDTMGDVCLSKYWERENEACPCAEKEKEKEEGRWKKEIATPAILAEASVGFCILLGTKGR